MPKKGEFKKTASERSKYQRKYNSTDQAKADRAQRNAARREAIEDGRAKKGDGKDVDHIKPIRDGGTNAKSNTRVIDKSKNRSDNGQKKKRNKFFKKT